MDMLVIGEAQDISKDLHIFFKNKDVSYSADNHQILYPGQTDNRTRIKSYISK